MPNYFAAERSFSTQNSIHSLICNILTHEMVATLMLVHINHELLNRVIISKENMDFFFTVAAGEGEKCGASESVGKGARCLNASEDA